MFEIGSSLSEARRKRGLELDAVQKALRIRRRYLEALEGDRFDLLPGEVYARGFLREYAEFLGLDGSLYVEEYNARFATREPQTITAQPSAPRLRRSRSRVPALAAAVVVVCVAGALVAWRLAGRGGPARPAPAATRIEPSVAAAATSARRRSRPRPAPAAAPASPPGELVLTAARGDCWVGVRIGSPSGRTLYWRTLPQGATIRFSLTKPLWLRVGFGQRLDATVDGKPLQNLPPVTGQLTVSY